MEVNGVNAACVDKLKLVSSGLNNGMIMAVWSQTCYKKDTVEGGQILEWLACPKLCAAIGNKTSSDSCT